VKSRGIYLDFSHDFVRLREPQMRNLIKWGVDRIYWSLDGVTKETYEKIRVGANFDKVVENVKKLIAPLLPDNVHVIDLSVEGK
ncbi:hypothetical protein LCGC14_2561510, partial [marine sediment metagenome]